MVGSGTGLTATTIADSHQSLERSESENAGWHNPNLSMSRYLGPLV